MRLKKLVVNDLFGLFTHQIDFNLEERITIIHAPNGFGKTVILKMISKFFSGKLSYFREFEYSSVIFEFDNSEFVEIVQSKVFDESVGGKKKGDLVYTVKYTFRDVSDEWNPFVVSSAVPNRRLLPSSVERYLPHLVRVGPSEWRDEIVQDSINLQDVVDRYWRDLPEDLRGNRRSPEWLQNIRGAVHCQLIETQRLISKKKNSSTSNPDSDAEVSAVRAYGSELASDMAKALAEAATLAQSLDRTFPNRILASIHGGQKAMSEAELRDRLASLEQKRDRLMKVDLLKKSDESAFISAQAFDEPTKRILTEYVVDTEKKLGVYTYILNKIELFSSLLNGRLNFKRVFIDREVGFSFIDIKGRLVSVDSLSSGEQHELILFYDLIFKTKENTLILIDEPEISLHIAWQKKFMTDLQSIIEISPLDVVVSTHSPQLISHHRNLVVNLRGPNV